MSTQDTTHVTTAHQIAINTVLRIPYVVFKKMLGVLAKAKLKGRGSRFRRANMYDYRFQSEPVIAVTEETEWPNQSLPYPGSDLDCKRDR